ncbi:MAG: glycosyltransferase family 4 protein [Parvibaculales bacterium]
MNILSANSDLLPDLMDVLSGTRPLRVLMPSYRSHPFVGGQGIYLRHLSKALVELGHKVDVISGPPYPDLDPRVGLIELPSLDMYAREHPILSLNWDILKTPLDLYEYLVHNSGGFPEPYTFGERLAKYMKDKIGDYDIVHDNQTLCHGLLKVRDMGLPVVGNVHHPITMDKRIDIHHAGSLSLKLLKWRWYSFLNMQIKVARRLNHIIVPSDNTQKDVIKDFGLKPDNIYRIHLGIDHETYKPVETVTRKPNRLMVTASADVPLKGLIYLIRAYHKLLDSYPDLELVVVGSLREGPTMDELDKRGIRDRVRFTSGLESREIAELYAEATVAVSPSVYEGFGFPAGEALACGLPLVATNGGSLPEVVGDAGLVVPHSDPDALAEAIDVLLADATKRQTLSAKARQHILDKFTWRHCAMNSAQIYRKAIADHHQIEFHHADD